MTRSGHRPRPTSCSSACAARGTNNHPFPQCLPSEPVISGCPRHFSTPLRLCACATAHAQGRVLTDLNGARSPGLVRAGFPSRAARRTTPSRTASSLTFRPQVMMNTGTISLFHHVHHLPRPSCPPSLASCTNDSRARETRRLSSHHTRSGHHFREASTTWHLQSQRTCRTSVAAVSIGRTNTCEDTIDLTHLTSFLVQRHLFQRHPKKK